jgi:hypothetical protein
MISSMITARPQQRYDHRLRQLVQRTGDLTIATDLGVPRSTARGWLRTAPSGVVSLDVADLTERELRQVVLKLRQRVQKLAALLRLALILLRVSGFTLAGERLPNGPDKLRILRAIDQARACLPLRALLRLLRLSPSRFTRGNGGTLSVHSTTNPVLSENPAEPSGRSIVVTKQPAEPRPAADRIVRRPRRLGYDQAIV